jgi:hypothetical protein
LLFPWQKRCQTPSKNFPSKTLERPGWPFEERRRPGQRAGQKSKTVYTGDCK